ncbi:MAG: 3-hydroxyacyl-CoA dehydrogenase NAD-binding domain-containing protein [Rhodobacteraceae bacterium]|nr:3-hydroxyacyl-CoA dehydrogenase NAD-binding domain-containing protein [Paracoccaceae bacterium]
MADFHYDRDADGVAVISWDVPGRRMNIMSWDCLLELSEHFDRAIADERVKGIVLTSSKADFAGGMDLDVLANMRARGGGDAARRVFDGVMEFHRIFRKIELAGRDPKTGAGGKPVVAALPGTGVGIGYEIPISCHRIIAADNPKAVIGLPEIKVGLFPGAGGTTRLVRRLGVPNAAPLLLKGSTPGPDKALALGTIDEVVPAGDLMERAREWVLSAGPEDITKPWDRKGFRIPGGGAYDRKGYMNFVGASAMLSGETSGVYPAANALMSAIYEGVQVPFDTALTIEARWFSKVLLNPSSTNMIRTLFLDRKQLEKGARRSPEVPRRDMRKIGVVGAGMMGSGIALSAARAGLDVILLDRDIDTASRGRESAAAILRKDAARGKLTADKQAGILERIVAADTFESLNGTELVIEAVFEDPAVKRDVIHKIGQSVGPDCVIATNTSTLPVTGLAEAVRDAERFLGMHFFSPVHRMMLVEIIRGKRSGDAAVALALDFTSRIRKTPILVNDARFFYTNRCIIPYLNEGIRMVGEGVAPALIENSARHAGMPVGPLQLIDETSIDLALSIAKATRAALGDAYQDDDVDAVLATLAKAGRYGRKAKAGFYTYDKGGRRLGLWSGLNESWPGQSPPPQLVRDRLLYVQALEAVRAFEAGVLTDLREGDVGAVLGWGFAPWSGGPFSWLDIVTAERAVTECGTLEDRFGPRFKVPETLLRMAAAGTGFRDQ